MELVLTPTDLLFLFRKAIENYEGPSLDFFFKRCAKTLLGDEKEDLIV